MKKDERFICTFKQVNAQVIEVWVDTKTGVNYMFIREGFSGGLTPLLDSQGNPVISKEYAAKD